MDLVVFEVIVVFDVTLLESVLFLFLLLLIILMLECDRWPCGYHHRDNKDCQ